MTAIWADLHRWLFYIALSVHPENLYDALIRAKSPVNCDTHFAENLFNRLFQTGSDFDLKKVLHYDKIQGIYELALPLPKSYGVFLVMDSVK